MREVTVFCDDATKDVGIWYKNPILQQMQGLLEQFNVKTFIKNWEEDIAKRELEFKTKQQEVEKQQGIVKNAILKASALVIKKETKKLNQTIQDLSMSINQSMDQSVRWENEQELTDPKTAKSMSKAMGSNLEIVQSETQKLKLLQGKCDKLAKDAFSERMQKFCSVRTSYAILKISEHQRILHQSIAPIMEVIKAMERLNKKTSKSAMFQPSDSSAPLTLEAQLLESYQQQIGLLNEIIFDLTSNTENDKTDEIIKKHYELVKQKFQGTATLVLLDDITKSKYKDEIPSKTNILMRAGFIANCYKIGAALLTNEMMSDRLTASIQGVTSGKTMTFKQG